MEKWPAEPNIRKDALETSERQVELVNLESLSGSDIREEDRAFIYTESGNRYMLRHSRARAGQLVIYDEREGGFSADNARQFLIKRGSSAIAELGRPLQYFAITDERTGTGAPVSSTIVTRIEIRRNLERHIRSHAAEPGGAFRIIAETMRAAAGPRRRSSNDIQGNENQ